MLYVYTESYIHSAFNVNIKYLFIDMAFLLKKIEYSETKLYCFRVFKYIGHKLSSVKYHNNVFWGDQRSERDSGNVEIAPGYLKLTCAGHPILTDP